MDVEAERINPYQGDQREKTQQVRAMFDNIAPAYDFMNRAMTFGIDKLWRAKAVRLIGRQSPKEILDVASGTGDLAILLARRIPDTSILGVDLSKGMLQLGERKVAEAGLADRVSFSVADCMQLPMPDDSFDCVSVAYGVRNFQNLLAGYKEMYRVLRPGGMLCVIELSTPDSKLVLPFYRFYTKCVIPAVGRMISKDVRAYSYLPESIAAVPKGREMLSLISEAGFRDARFRRLTFGVCTIYTAFK